MGLQLNVSNSLKQLVDELSKNLGKPLPTVFHPHYIITQTDGMNNWLKIEIASRLGITANLQFFKPNDLITHIYYILGGPYDQVLNKSNLQWILYEIFDDFQFKSKFKHIAQYYADSDIKRIAIAEKVADLFDQYQIYRPEIIEEWNKSSKINSHEANWQKYLWQVCLEKVGDKMPDKTRIGKYILNALQSPINQEKLKDHIPRIHFFGISIITSYHLQIFHLLARHVDISFNLLNPTPNIYWFEDKSEKYIAKWNSRDRDNPKHYEVPIEGNSLLTNWGKVIQDTFSLFFEEDIFFNQYNDKGVEPQPINLLGKLQNDIYHNLIYNSRNKLTVNDITDGSVSINSCFTPVREVEVLYNYLTKLIDNNPNLYSPRDIVVMVTDIDLYAPYIKAIFNSAPYKFPYAVADERLDRGDSLFGAINAFLELDGEALKAEDVMQLLDWDYIKNRFRLTDIAFLRKAVDSANIRFGIKGDLHSDTIHVSWLNGLKRIMYGVCLYSEDEYCLEGDRFFPVDIAEGEKAEELIRFTHFVTVLIDSLTQQTKKRRLTDWGDYMIDVVNNLTYLPEDDENPDYQILLSYVEKLNLLALDTDEKISYAVFKHNFLNIISGESRSGNFASGGITFCSLIPMRSIPFKIVALLGMNSNKFPRNEIQSGFNLIQEKPKKGDRNIKDNDKHLFLETVLSAQEHLFISYIGKNVKDNSNLPPSILVDELIDYIAGGVSDQNEDSVLSELIITHPLHNFSAQPKGVFSYITSRASKHDPQRFYSGDKINSPQSKEITEIKVSEFIRFFKDPFEYYYHHVLNINYNEKDILLRETEWFELDSLHQWIVKNDLLHLDEKKLPEYISRGVRTGLLPLKNSAVYFLNQILAGLRTTKGKLEHYKTEFEEKCIPINIEIDQTLITGNIEHVYKDTLIMVLFSKNKNKYLLELYIEYLLAKANGNSIHALMIDNNSDQVYKFSKYAIDQTKAIVKLTQLLQLFRGAHQRLFIFYPGFENDPNQITKVDHKKFQKGVERLAEYNPYLMSEYHAGLFENECIFEQYLANSAIVFDEIYAILQQ